jgi:hypothetical protein
MYPEEGWQYEKLKGLSEIAEFDRYCQMPSSHFVADVELSGIVGTTHASHSGYDWVTMRDTTLLKKWSDEDYQAMVRDDRDHSQVKGNKTQPITLCQYGDEYIICDEGNHRICHAKFAGFRTIRVQVKRYLIGSPRPAP